MPSKTPRTWILFTVHYRSDIHAIHAKGPEPSPNGYGVKVYEASTVDAERERMLGLLDQLFDPGECDYDHHGYCQSHALDEKPCPHELTKALLHEYGRLLEEE